MPLFSAICLMGAERARKTMSTPIFSSPLAAADLLHRLLAAKQGHAAARQHAFHRRGLGGVQRVLDAGLGLLHLGLGAAADLDHGDAAGELGQPLLQLLAIVVAIGGLDLPLELLDAGLDVGRLAAAFDDRRVVLVDR